jgi:GTP-binding protein
MIIKSAEFLISSSTHTGCPDPNRPEYAFIGRSNVGKSSLINMLTGRKKLAKTSSTPGKTQLINHFTINDEWYLVDLPGYGYAKVSKKNRAKFRGLINNYIGHRENLESVFVLIDSRIPPQKIDLEFMEWLGEKQVPFAIVFTKTDKQGSSANAKNLAAFKKELLKNWAEIPMYFLSSAETGLGKDEILSLIGQINEAIKQEKK